MTTFWAKMLLPKLKRRNFVQHVLFEKNCVRYGLDPDPDTKLFQSQEPKPDPELIVANSQHCR